MNNSEQHHIPADTHVNLMAEQDAESDAKKVTWFFIGFLGNILGVLIASIYEPTPPASRLLGKSPEHTALYTDSYKAKGRSIQVRQAFNWTHYSLCSYDLMGDLSGSLGIESVQAI